MAKFDLNFPKDLLGDLLDNDAEGICVEAIREAAPILVGSMKKSAQAAVLHEGESEMVQSITASVPKRTRDGSAIIATVGPRGYSDHYYYDKKSKKKRKYKVGNALKAIWKEYGIAGKQAPRPFITTATKDAEEAVIQALQDSYNKRTGGSE